MGRVVGPHSDQRTSDGCGPLSRIAQSGSSQRSLQRRAEHRKLSNFEHRRLEACGRLSAVS
jgi:hypothetical protein